MEWWLLLFSQYSKRHQSLVVFEKLVRTKRYSCLVLVRAGTTVSQREKKNKEGWRAEVNACAASRGNMCNEQRQKRALRTAPLLLLLISFFFSTAPVMRLVPFSTFVSDRVFKPWSLDSLPVSYWHLEHFCYWIRWFFWTQQVQLNCTLNLIHQPCKFSQFKHMEVKSKMLFHFHWILNVSGTSMKCISVVAKFARIALLFSFSIDMLMFIILLVCPVFCI